MTLDLQPVLDLQPAEDAPGATPKLDLQPVTAPQITDPNAQLAQRVSTLGRGGPTLFGGHDAPDLSQFMEMATTPAIAIPRIPQQKGKLAQLSAGTVNALMGIPEFVESPLGLLTLPLGASGAAGRTALTKGFGAWMATQVPGASTEAGRQSVEGTLQQATEADVNMGASVVLPALPVLTKEKGTPAQATETKPETVSEFGGEAEVPPAQPKPLDLQPVSREPGTETPAPNPPPPSVQPEVAKAVLEAKGNGIDLQPVPAKAEISLKAGEDSPFPESVDTLNHQLDLLRAGKRQAVLFTPGEEVPQWALDSDQYDTHTTPAGTFLYDAAELTKDQLDDAVKNNTVGRVLGYGIDAKPAAADIIGAVTVRDAKGVEKQSVLTDAKNLPGVLKAAQAIAGEGDSVRLEDPQETIARRVQAAAPKPTALTERQRMAEEAIDAMNELRQQKQESEKQNATIEGNQRGGVPPQREDGNAGGTAAETGAGDRLQRETPEPATEEALAGLPLGERPPDILDWIADNYRRGVRPSSAEDYGDYVRAATGASRDLLKLTKGERGDRVLKEMHDQGQWLRIENEDQLYQAMNDAAQARKGWAEQEAAIKAAPDIFAKLDGLKLETNGQLHAFGLLPEAWNTLIDFVKLGVRGGMAIADAVQFAIGKFKAQFPDQQFDEAGAADHLRQNIRTSATGDKLVQQQTTPDEVKAAVRQYVFERAPHQTAENTANGLLAHYGIETAQDLWRGSWPELPGDVRAKLIGAVARQLRLEAQHARTAGRTAEAAALAQREGAWWNEVLPRNTELGQYISALNGITDASPEGYVAKVKQSLDSDAQETLDRQRNVTTTMKAALDAGRAEGIEAVRQDPEVNTAARKAVDEHILTQAGDGASPLHQAVVMEMAGPWSESPAIMAAVREQVRSKADELLNRSPRPAGFTPAQHLRQILDDLAQRAAGIFAGHIQGSEPGLSIVDKLQQRLGIDKPTAQKLATQLSKEWDRRLEEAKKALNQRLINARAKFKMLQKFEDHTAAEKRALAAASKTVREAAVRAAQAENARRVAQASKQSGEAESARAQAKAAQDALAAASKTVREAAARAAEAENKQRSLEAEMNTWAYVDRALVKELRAQRQKLGDILRQSAADRNDTGKHIADKITDGTKFTGPKADKFRALLKSRYDALVAEAQRVKLASLQKAAVDAANKASQPAPRILKPMERAFRKLVEIDRLAPVDGKRFFEVVKDALKLPQLTDEDAAKLRDAVQKAQDMPDGFLRQRAMVDVMKLESKIRGDQRWWNKGMGMFYANMLSGLTTYAKIPFENLNLFVGHTLLNYLTRPGELVHPAEYAAAVAGALKRGYAKGGLQAADTLRTGTLTGVYAVPKPPGPMELQPFGKRMEPLNFWKWFTRAIGVAHEATFKPAWELKQTMLAREVARNEGLAGKQLQQRVADLLGNTDTVFAKAQAQALQELAAIGNNSSLDLARRTREIIEQGREVNMEGSTATARDYAQRVAYLNPSYGFWGAIGDNLVSGIERLRSQFPFLGAGVKSQIPFVKVATNIVNEKLNWTPLGILRAWRGSGKGELYGRPIMDSNEVPELYAKGIAGTIALAGLWELRAHVHGAGPATPQQQRQLMATGWIPHSFEWNGKFYSYNNTPLMLPFAVIGNAEDFSRYAKGNDDEASTRTAYALKGVSADLLQQGYLDSVGKLLEAVGNRNVSAGGSQMEKILVRTAGTAVIPNLLNQVDKVFDPTVRSQTGLQALLASQVPFVRRGNDPVLNALGEPVTSAPFHYWFSQASPDPLWQTLAAQHVTVPEPSRQLTVGDKRLGPDFVRAMTPDELYELTATSGPMIRAALEAHLGDGSTFDLGMMEPGKAKAYVEKVAEQQRQTALRQMNLTP